MGGVSVGGVSVEGSLSRGVSVQGWGSLLGGGVYVTFLLSLHQLRLNTSAAAYIVLLSHVTCD